MSLDGNGSYSPPAPQFPAISNTIIYADDFNQIILDIATALSTAIFRDGQAAFVANQSMGGFQLKDLANGTAPQDATTVLQVFTDPHFKATTAEGVKVSGTAMTVSVSVKIDFSDSAAVILPPETHGVTPDVADNTTKVATTEFVQNVAFNTALPEQAGNAGKVVTTDGSQASWKFFTGSQYFMGQN